MTKIIPDFSGSYTAYDDTTPVKRNSVTLPDGREFIVMYRKRNPEDVSVNTAGFRIYEVNSDDTLTLRHESYGHDISYEIRVMGLSCNADGTKLFVAWRSFDQKKIISCWINVATWIAEADVTQVDRTADNYHVKTFDIDINDANAILFCYFWVAGSVDTGAFGCAIAIRHTGGAVVTLDTASSKLSVNHKLISGYTGVADVAVSWIKGATAGARRFIYGFGILTKNSGNDLFVKGGYLCQVNEANGTGLIRRVDTPYWPQAPSSALTSSYRVSHRLFYFNDRADGMFGEVTYAVVGSGTNSQVRAKYWVKTLTFGASVTDDTYTSRIFVTNHEVACAGLNLAAIGFHYYRDDEDVIRITTAAPFINGDQTDFRYWIFEDASIGFRREGGVSRSYYTTSTNPTPFKVGSAIGRKASQKPIFVSWAAFAPWIWVPNPLPEITQIRPASGEEISGMPVVYFRVNYRSGRNGVFAQLGAKSEFATNPGFTSGYYEQTRYGIGPVATNSVGQSEDVYVGYPALIPGVYYFRMTPYDPWGRAGNVFTNSSSFQISHKPSAVDLRPNADLDSAMAYSDPTGLGYTDVPVSWRFSDPWYRPGYFYPDSDMQTAYQILAYQDETLVYDSGKVAAPLVNTFNGTGFVRVPAAYKAERIDFTVLVWDTEDTSSGIQAWGSFVTYDPPEVNTVFITTIDSEGRANTARPTIGYTATAVPDHPIQTVEVKFTQGGTTIYTKNLPYGGSPGYVTPDKSILDNESSYSVEVGVRDDQGVLGKKVLNFDSYWPAPPSASPVKFSLDYYNLELRGFVELKWTKANRQPEFLRWNIYRKVDKIDANRNVVAEGEWEYLDKDETLLDTYVFRDYFAPSGMKVSYAITQVVYKFDSEQESRLVAVASGFPVSEGYWLLDPTPEDELFAAFRLWNVTQDSYSPKYEENVQQIIGRGRRVDRGDYLGIEGSMTCQIRDTVESTARQKKLRLEEIRKEARSLYLRTPFGDTWFVNIMDMQIDRIAGVGLSEFCDITIPYQEVYYSGNTFS